MASLHRLMASLLTLWKHYKIMATTNYKLATLHCFFPCRRLTLQHVWEIRDVFLSITWCCIDA